MDRKLVVDLIVFVVGEDVSSISPFSISSHVFSMYFPGFLLGEDGLVAISGTEVYDPDSIPALRRWDGCISNGFHGNTMKHHGFSGTHGCV